MLRLVVEVVRVAALAALAGIALAAGAAWISLAAERDPNGMFGEITAAWVQAIGSVVAIAAAIVIDQGAARRQREQLKAAELERVREKVEVALAVGSLAAFALGWTRNTDGNLQTPEAATIVGQMVGKWAGVMNDTRAALTMLSERITDPVLLSDLVPFLNAMTPPSDWLGVDLRGTVAEARHAMEEAGARLIAATQAIADDADIEMHLPALRLEPHAAP